MTTLAANILALLGGAILSVSVVIVIIALVEHFTGE